MVDFIQDHGQTGDTHRYSLQSGVDHIDVLVSGGNVVFRQNGSDLGELSDLVVGELREVERTNSLVYKRSREILTALGEYIGDEGVAPLELDSENPLFVRVRHYTKRSCADRIVDTRTFGGVYAPRKPDQGKFFVELARAKALSAREAEDTYLLKDGKGEAYVEFLVDRTSLGKQRNPLSGRDEYFVLADGKDNDVPVYHIPSEVKRFR